MLRRDAYLFVPRLIKLVRHILYIVCGLQTFKHTTWHDEEYWSARTTATEFTLMQPQNHAVQKLAAVMAEAPEQLLQQANECLKLYDADAPSILRDTFSQGDLEREVASMMRCIDEHVEKLQPWGYKFVQHYQQIKQAFPDMFQTNLQSDA